jgi:hypothetical protein
LLAHWLRLSFPRTQRPTFQVGGQLGLSSEAYSRPLITIRRAMHCSQYLCLNNLHRGGADADYPLTPLGTSMIFEKIRWKGDIVLKICISDILATSMQ